MPHRWSRPPCPQTRTVGFVMGSGGGRSVALDSSRVRAAFCAAVRPECIGWRAGALRYAVAKLLKALVVCDIAFMRLKLGNNKAVVAEGASVAGNELAVIKTFVNGYHGVIFFFTTIPLRSGRRIGGLQTSNASPPFPITPLRPFTKAAVAPSSSSRLLAQSSFPVQRSTCSVYGAMVFNSGVLRSMSRLGGVEAHEHVGNGQDSV